MLGRQMKSGVRVEAEKIVSEHTNQYGFISIKAVQSIRNQPTIESVLRDWGYEAVVTPSETIKGYQKTIYSTKGLLDAKPEPQPTLVKKDAKVAKPSEKPTVTTYDRVLQLADKWLKKNGKFLINSRRIFLNNRLLLKTAILELDEQWQKKGKTIASHHGLRDGKWQITGYKLISLD